MRHLTHAIGAVYRMVCFLKRRIMTLNLDKQIFESWVLKNWGSTS